MGRPRNPERDLSLKRYLETGGKISTAELAKLARVTESRIRKWKSEDKWEEALKNKPKKRGGQKGNKNAAGKTPKLKISFDFRRSYSPNIICYLSHRSIVIPIVVIS